MRLDGHQYQYEHKPITDFLDVITHVFGGSSFCKMIRNMQMTAVIKDEWFLSFLSFPSFLSFLSFPLDALQEMGTSVAAGRARGSLTSFA